MATDPEPARSLLRSQSLAIAALVVAAGFLGSRILGLLRSVIIAESFGTSPELDAYWVAFRLPDLVFQLLAGATLASAFIPVFAGVRLRDGEDAAWRLASSVLNLVLAATVVFAAVAFLLAPTLVPLLAPGLGKDTGQEAELRSLAVDLTRIMLLSPILFAVSGMFMGILNARRHFLTPALAPMLYNVSIIVAAFISDDIKVLAVGVVAGAALHLAVQLPDLKAAGMVYRLLASWRDSAVREVGTLMAPRVLGLAASQVSFYFVAVYFASRLESGAISAVNFAWLIVMTPLGVVGMAISTAAFPTLADLAARNDREFGATISRALRLILYLSLPIGAGLLLLAKPLVVVLLQRGAFDLDSTDLTTQALRFYAIGLFAHSGIEILSRGFYAQGDTRTPVGIAVGAMLLNLLLAALLVGPMEVRGLGLALSLAAIVEFLILATLLMRRLPGVNDPEFRFSLLRFVVALLLTTATIAAGRWLLQDVAGLDPDSWLDAFLILSVAGGAGGLVYVASTLALRCSEPLMLLSRLPLLSRLLPGTPVSPDSL